MPTVTYFIREFKSKRLSVLVVISAGSLFGGAVMVWLPSTIDACVATQSTSQEPLGLSKESEQNQQRSSTIDPCVYAGVSGHGVAVPAASSNGPLAHRQWLKHAGCACRCCGHRRQRAGLARRPRACRRRRGQGPVGLRRVSPYRRTDACFQGGRRFSLCRDGEY
jgi:hypothetical protein